MADKNIMSQRAIEYMKKHTKRFVLNLHLEKDKDIIEHLKKVSNKSKYVKGLIRNAIKD